MLNAGLPAPPEIRAEFPSILWPGIRILATGFGPFPGVLFNASGVLVRHLEENVVLTAPGARLMTAVLPTDWLRGSIELERLLDKLQPDVILHFGVARRATGFELETRAFNATRRTPDCAGRVPARRSLRRGAPPVLSVTLPVDRLVQRLRLAGVPASLSRDAGRYLCNAILYESLLRAQAAARLTLIGFIHIPALPASAVEHAASASRCGWPQLKIGAETLIRAMIPYAMQARRLRTLGARRQIG